MINDYSYRPHRSYRKQKPQNVGNIHSMFLYCLYITTHARAKVTDIYFRVLKNRAAHNFYDIHIAVRHHTRTRTHTHTKAHAHPRINAHITPHTRRLTRVHTHTHTHTNAQMQKHAQTHARTHTHKCTNTNAQTQRARTHKHALAQTHTHKRASTNPRTSINLLIQKQNTTKIPTPIHTKFRLITNYVNCFVIKKTVIDTVCGCVGGKFKLHGGSYSSICSYSDIRNPNLKQLDSV
jgi:hypothetical protein